MWGGVLASLNRRGTLDDLERCRVFRPLIDHLVDNAPLHRHFAGQEVVALERVLDLLGWPHERELAKRELQRPWPRPSLPLAMATFCY